MNFRSVLLRDVIAFHPGYVAGKVQEWQEL